MGTPESREHGSLTSYKHGCHCELCTGANREAGRGYKRRKRELGVDSLRTPAEPVREHIRLLVKGGAALNVIAQAAGVERNQLYRLMNGRPNQGLPPAASISRALADRIMAVGAEVRVKSGYYPAMPTQSRLRDLMLRQWPIAEVARAKGLHCVSLQNVNKGTRKAVLRSTDVKVGEFFREHRHDLGPSVQIGREAARRGYLPIWRSMPEPDQDLYPVLLAPNVLVQLELDLALRIRRWLLLAVRDGYLLELPPSGARFLAVRFGLNRPAMLPIAELAVRSGMTPSALRRRERDALGILLVDSRVPTQGYDQELRVYMTHPGLLAL